MTDFLKSAARLAVALAAGLLVSVAARADDTGQVRLKLAAIMDPSGFEKPMTAARSVIPADWTATGGVIWRLNGDCNTGQTVDWTASSADGKAFIRMLPTASWRYNNQGYPTGSDCIPAAFSSADQYVQGFIGQLRDAKIETVERDPATIEVLSQYPFSSEMPGDPYSKTWWDAASVTFTYAQAGEPYTGVMILFTMHNYTVSGQSFGFGPPLQMGYGTAAIQVLLSAPTDRFAEFTPAFELFLKNYQVDPDWQARMNRYNQQMNQQALQSSRKISSIISNTYSEISDMNMESWRKRNESSDRMQRETSEAIRGVETYDADTPTGQIELPSGYDRAFQLNDDTFVVTNDAFYEPYRDSGIDGRELSAQQ